MNTNSLEQIVRDRLNNRSGKEAQQLIWDILIQHYPDLQTPKMQHDLGNDCYTIDSKTFFAVYIPESAKYDNEITKKKISYQNPKKSGDTGDYEKFVKNWKGKYGFTQWVFITKENQMGIPHQQIVALNAQQDGVKKEHWGIEQLVKKVLELPQATIERIFNIEASEVTNVYVSLEEKEEREIVIVDEIFSHVLITLKDYTGVERDGHIYVEDKIKLNFTEAAEKAAVETYMKGAYTKLTLIEQRVQSEDAEVQKDLQQDIFGKFFELKQQGLSNIDILHELFAIFIPPGKERNSSYVNLAKAFVLLYFDDCTIFDKTKTEKSK